MSGAPKMTIRQIAEAAGCNHKTVRNIANRLYPEMAHNGIRHEYNAEQSFTIMSVLPKRNIVGAIGASQKREGDLPKNGKLPAGIQLREMRLIYGAPEAARRLDVLLGYSKATPQIEAPATPEQAQVGFALVDAAASGLPIRIVTAAQRAAATAAHAVLTRELSKIIADRKQGRLGL
jgi:hypothetical protein